MSYRLMYATAGLGAEAASSPKPTSTMSLSSDKEARPVRDLQQMLQNRGFSPGPIDGVWGPSTDGALMRAIGSVATKTVSPDRRTIWLLRSDWARIQALPRSSGPEIIPTAPTENGVPAMVEEPPNYLPWVLGAGGLLAVGGYFMWKGKKRVRRNRRRRRARR